MNLSKKSAQNAVKKLAKAKNLEVSMDKSRGKGSHITLYYGEIPTLCLKKNFVIETIEQERSLK